MTHCLDYWRKWQREGNFCGLRKQDAEDNNTYLSYVEKITGNGTGLDADQVFENFSAGAARPLIRCKDEDVQVKALNYVVACLKRKETVTGGDLQQSINMWLGKPEKPAKVTQLREEEPAVPVEPVPVLSLGQQMKAKETGPVKYTCVYPDSCLMREKEPELSPALCGDCKSLRPAPTTCTQSNGENCNIHGVDCKGDILTCNRYTTEPNPTRLKSPFQTAAEVLAHDRDPLGVNKMFTKPEPAQETPQDPLKNLKENRVFYAEKLLECYPDRTKLAVKDLMRDHPSWKTVADVFYFGIDCLTERKR